MAGPIDEPLAVQQTQDGASVAPATEPATAKQRRWHRRHSLVVRICHWVGAVTFVALVYTGMQMLLDYPELYWGKTGYMGHEPALHLRELGFDLRYTQYGQHVWHIGNFEFPGNREWGRYNHFFFAWLFVLTGLVYVIWNIVNGHFWKNMVPRREELRSRHLLSVLRDHALLRRTHGGAARGYNTLQKTTYLIVIFGLCSLVTLSGLAQSPGFVAEFPIVLDVFGGGRQTARTLHVVSMVLLLLFLVVHLFQVVVHGFVNEVRAMITGRFALPDDAVEESKK